MKPRILLTSLIIGLALKGMAEEAKPPKAAVTTMKPDALADFDAQPQAIRDVITTALKLTEKNLTYTFGSASPDKGGMDCSGTIFHVLQSEGIKTVPRQSDHIAGWVMDESTFVRTKQVHSFDHDAFHTLKPGDLVFWSGTYASTKRKIPVTHVMLYLGKRASDGKPLVFGASNGRTYDGQKRCGVSVFNFRVPSAKSRSSLYGFGPIPGLRPTDSTLVETPMESEEIRKPAREEIRKAELPAT
jgi:hypothetical protein